MHSLKATINSWVGFDSCLKGKISSAFLYGATWDGNLSLRRGSGISHSLKLSSLSKYYYFSPHTADSI